MMTETPLKEAPEIAIQRTGRTRLAALLAAVLVRRPPFDRMSEKAIAFVAAQAEQVFFASQSEILTPRSGTAGYLYVLERGIVRRRAAEGTFTLEAGTCFPISALAADLATDASYTAIEDCFCLRLAVEDFHHLLHLSPEFSQYCIHHLAAGLTHARHALETLTARRGNEQEMLHSPLSAVGSRQPVSVAADVSVRAALERMSAHRIGAMIVTRDGEPVGVFTRSDLLERVVLPGRSVEVPIGEAMSPKPLTLPESATAHDAQLAMAARKVRHIPVVDQDGRLSGVVSERDVFALHRNSPWEVREAIEAAGDVEALARAAGDVRQLAQGMLERGTASPQLTHFISMLNDALTRRVLELNLERHDLYGIDWCWLAFGSEGRQEQTFNTDQDNGIVFVCDDFSDRDQLRLRLTEFAQEVNRDLDRVGFPLCKGNIMAGNPQWCLTIEQWEEQFTAWVRSPEPAALLNATIFFDFRPVFGKGELAERLRRHLLRLTTTTPLFLKAMAVNALDVEPPLGTFRDFRTDLEPEHPGTIDLKKYGSRLFVDAARILALATGARSTNTAQRLKAAAECLNLNAGEFQAAVDAFNFVQLLRLRIRVPEGAGQAANNLVAPDSLNELDRRILKEAFRQAKKLQLRLKLDYQTG